MAIPISFADLTHTRQGISGDTFPLGISFIASYALKKLKDKINVNIFKYPDDLKNYLEKETPKIACFSNYSWSIDLAHKFATKIKEKSPSTITVFGGPNYPIVKEESKEFLFSYPSIDFYIAKEGEQAFVELFNKLSEYNFEMHRIKEKKFNMPNCDYVYKGEFFNGDLISRLSNLDEIPSPYLNGLNDKFFDGKLTPLMQTTRGCPFTCAYCQEGQSYFNKISRFSFQRVKNELDYIAQRSNVPNLMLTDSNFGMYSKDIDISKHIALIRKVYGYPDFLAVSSGKNKKDIILKCVEVLGGMVNLSASVQSTDPVVLNNIKRENISLEQIIELSKNGEKLGARSMGEIILSLPGDSKKAHFKSIFDMMDSELNLIRTYQFGLLPASELSSKENIKKYGMKDKYRIIPRCFGNYEVYGKNFPSVEIERICTSNNTLPEKDYLDCRLLTLTTEIFYNGGIFNELTNFLKLNNIPPSYLIKNIYKKILKNPEDMKEICDGYLKENQEGLMEKFELERFLHETKIEDYVLKGVGVNELFKYKSLSYLNKMNELHKIAFSEARSLLDPLDNKTDDYLNELFEFSLLRKNNFLQLDKESTQRFHYDFVSLLQNKFNKNPFSFFNSQRINIKVSYSDMQKNTISKYLSQYGNTLDGVVRIFHRSNDSTLFREAFKV